MTLASAPVPSPLVRVEALDGLRGMAVLMVVAMHAMFFGVPLPGVPPLSQDSAYVRLVGLGWSGVDVFFVLSGFLITGILVQSKDAPHYLRNFYARRVLRIFPLYYVVLALLLWGLQRPPTTPGETAAYLLYVQNFVHAFGGDAQPDIARDVTWSLAIEEQFYLVWPTVVLFASRRALPRLAIVMIVLAIASRFVGLWLGVPKPYFLTPCRLDALGVGALLAVVPLPRLGVGVSLAVGGAVALAAIAWATGNALPHEPTMQRFGLMAALAMASGALVCARHPGPVARALQWAPLRSLGRYSYCVYLVHFLVVERLAIACYGDLTVPANALQQWLVAHVAPTLLLALFGLACVVVSWAIGLLSWHLFEKHLLALKRLFPSGGA